MASPVHQGSIFLCFHQERWHWAQPGSSVWFLHGYQLSGICVLMVSSLKCALFYTLILSLSLVGTWKILLSLSSLVPESLYCLGQTEVLCQHCELECSLKTDTENKKDWAKKACKDLPLSKGQLAGKTWQGWLKVSRPISQNKDGNSKEAVISLYDVFRGHLTWLCQCHWMVLLPMSLCRTSSAAAWVALAAWCSCALLSSKHLSLQG